MLDLCLPLLQTGRAILGFQGSAQIQMQAGVDAMLGGKSSPSFRVWLEDHRTNRRKNAGTRALDHAIGRENVSSPIVGINDNGIRGGLCNRRQCQLLLTKNIRKTTPSVPSTLRRRACARTEKAPQPQHLLVPDEPDKLTPNGLWRASDARPQIAGP